MTGAFDEEQRPEYGSRWWRQAETPNRAGANRKKQHAVQEKMNGWRSRLEIGMCGAAAAMLHAILAANVPNSDIGMFIYHWSAASFELLLIAVAPHFLHGKLCDRIQLSCVASICVNLFGWLAYLAWAPPVFYDTAIGVISLGQILLLLMGGKHVDYSHLVGYFLLRDFDPRRPKLNLKKAQ